MSQYPYSLEKYKNPASNIICSGCGEKRARAYVNNATGERLGNHVSKCERVDSCGYHFTPKMFFEANPEAKPSDFKKWQPLPEPPQRPVSFIDKSIFNKTLTLGVNNTNTFITFLIALFGKERAEMLVNRYHIGTTKSGEVIFYQVDLQGDVRSGKVMKYNITDSNQTSLGKDCKRDKSINPNWVHSKLKLENFNLNQCLFGGHLINESQTIAVVESAKTAIIASVYFPQFVWVSCESKDGLSLDKLKVLKGRNVVLFPDLGGFDKWTAKAKQMIFCKSVVVSDLLEKVATVDERASGLDLADYLLRLPAPAEALPAVAENVKISLGNISQSEVATETQSFVSVENDPIAINDTPLGGVVECDTPNFWDEIPQISNDEFKESVMIIDWFNKHLKVFDGVFILDGMAINDIQDVIVKHLKVIAENQSSSVISIKFLKRVKVAFMGA